jgi:hypothetical protein
LACGNCSKGAGSGDAEGVHGFSHQIFTEDGADGGFAVATSREGSAAGAFELDVASLAVSVDDFTEQEGAAVAELGDEVAELVAGVGLRDDGSAFGGLVAREDFRGVELIWVEAEFYRQGGVELEKFWGGSGVGLAWGVEAFEISCVGVVEVEAGRQHKL